MLLVVRSGRKEVGAPRREFVERRVRPANLLGCSHAGNMQSAVAASLLAGALQITRTLLSAFPETPRALRENPASAYTTPARRLRLPTRIQSPCSFRGSAFLLSSLGPAPDRALTFPQTRASRFPIDRAAPRDCTGQFARLPPQR